MSFFPVLSFLLVVVCSAPCSAFEWSIYHKGKPVPQGLFSAGSESDGRPLAISVVLRDGGRFPGKMDPKNGKAYYSFGGKEYQSDDLYEVFTGDGTWVKAPGGRIPTGAIRAGQDIDGSPLYIIRARHAKGLHPGRTDGKGNAYIPYGGKEIRVSDYEVLIMRDVPDYLSVFRWVEEHPRGSVVMQASYDLFGVEGRCNLYSLSGLSSLKHEVKDSSTKGVKQSDLSDAGLKRDLSAVLSRKNPKLEVYRVLKNDQSTSYSWGKPYGWGSYRFNGKDDIRVAYPRGGIIEYRPKRAQVEVLAKNSSPTYLPDDLGSNERILTLVSGSLPSIHLENGKPGTVKLTVQRLAKQKLGHDVVFKVQVFSQANLYDADQIANAVEPALHLGDGVYRVEVPLPAYRRTGVFPVMISAAYAGKDGTLRALNEDLIVRGLEFECQTGSFRLVLKNDPNGTGLSSLRKQLSANRSFSGLRPGMQTVGGKKLFVVDAAALSGQMSPPADADGVLVRFDSTFEMAEAEKKLAIPDAWKVKLTTASGEVMGKMDAVAEAYSYFSSINQAFMDSYAKQLKALTGETGDIVKVLQTPKGATVYELESMTVVEQKMPNGITIIEKGVEKVPVGSKEVAASRISRYTSNAQTVVGTLGIGMVAYASATNIITAARAGDSVDVALYSVEGGVKLASQVVSLSKYAKTSGATALGYVDAGMGFVRSGIALYKFSKANSAWERQEKGQEVVGMTLNTGLSVLAVAYPPAAVIDPTFRATVTVMNRIVPGSKANKELTDAALADVGTALSFMASYLTTGIAKEVAEQALKQGIEEARTSCPNMVFMAPR